jgi:V/A-type H+-transporting ATPase subunit K
METLLIGLGFVVLLLITGRRLSNRTRIKSLVAGLLALNATLFLGALALVGLQWLATPTPVFAAPLEQTTGGISGQVAIGAALSTGLAAIGAGIAVGIAGAAAIGAITEKPEALGRTLIFVGLAEGIAIYGLIISFLIITR